MKIIYRKNYIGKHLNFAIIVARQTDDVIFHYDLINDLNFNEYGRCVKLHQWKSKKHIFLMDADIGRH